jgi:excisionase family DNA binding protein
MTNPFDDIVKMLDVLNRKLDILIEAKKPEARLNEYITINEASKMLGYSVSSIYKMTAKNEIPCIKSGKGNKILFDRLELLEFINRHTFRNEPKK